MNEDLVNKVARAIQEGQNMSTFHAHPAQAEYVLAIISEEKPVGSNKVKLSDMQKEIYNWSTHNFGRPQIRFHVNSFLGVVEEVGELAHCILKASQGIRGSFSEHVDKAADAIGDIIVYLLDFTEGNKDIFKVDVDYILARVWARVKQRDWTTDSSKGGEADGERVLEDPSV